ncbi:MAG: YggT family protein [bacterium]|nr:YggT family protein [bacterium]MDZ4247926.1 hypothetical protein [Patescibacteria group bacterium]
MVRTSTASKTEVEETRSDVPERQDDRRVRKVEDIIWFIIAVIVSVILIRFILLLFGARTGVPFVDFWYGMTAPLIAPFAGIFGSLDTYNDYTGQRIELEALVAMLIYGVLGYLVVWATRLLRHEPTSQ